ncbi:MAG: zinc-dependent metalloprotease [Actinomycetota bacterium]|nr:zinc-dependent metalloprotease [Actinomycetota bacterium]
MTENPFGFNPLETVFKDLMNMLSGQRDVHKMVALQMATSIASSSDGENVDPSLRMKVESMVDIARNELLLNSPLGSSAPLSSAKIISANGVARVENLLARIKPLTDILTTQTESSLTNPPSTAPELSGIPLGQIMAMTGPMMIGVNIGSAVGHLVSEIHGDSDILWPRYGDEIAIYPHRLRQFAQDWSLDLDAYLMWTLINQLVSNTVIESSHISTELNAIAKRHITSMSSAADALTNQLGEMDLSDPTALERLGQDPSQLFSVAKNDEQDRLVAESQPFLAVVVALIDWFTLTSAKRLIGPTESINEARVRVRRERFEGLDLFEALFGIGVSSATYEVGNHFIFGVVERDAEEKLIKIVEDPNYMPTPSEVEAPGLWLARIETI